MSVVEEPNGKPQIFSKWGHKEFLVIRGICFFLFTDVKKLIQALKDGGTPDGYKVRE